MKINSRVSKNKYWLAFFVAAAITPAYADNKEVFEGLFPTLLTALDETASAPSGVHAILKKFSKSLTALSKAEAEGRLQVDTDLQAIVEEYKIRLKNIANLPDSPQSERDAFQIADDAEINVRFIDYHEKGAIPLPQFAHIAARVETHECKATKRPVDGYSVKAKNTLFIDKPFEWEPFSGDTNNATARLRPGRWVFRLQKGNGAVIEAIRSVDIEPVIQFCVN